MQLKEQFTFTTVTVDIVLLRFVDQVLEILLIQRLRSPYIGQWAIPGGKLDQDDETLEMAAERELREETNVQAVSLRQIYTFGNAGRDPRGRFISVAYFAFVDGVETVAGDDAAEVQWIPLYRLPRPLAFDHQAILMQVFKSILSQLDDIPTALSLLPKGTTLQQLFLIKQQLDQRLWS